MKAVILVIDGLGVGAMDDVSMVRPQDVGTNTFKHVLEANPDVRLRALESLGAGLIVRTSNLRPIEAPLASYGASLLAHEGADTFQGHQEIAGSLPKPPVAIPFRDAAQRVRHALETAGYRAEQPDGSGGYLVVNGLVVVADNIEGEPYLNYNVTAPLDSIPFDEVLRIGQIVRRYAQVSRVIVLGGRGITIDNIMSAIERTPYGATGVNCTRSGVYKRGYVVRHLGNTDRPDLQVTGLVRKAGLPVVLIGKAADVLHADGAIYEPCVDTEKVMKTLCRYASQLDAGLIVANVQETDLAGHSRDPVKWAEALMVVDQHLPKLIEVLNDEDLLFVTGDHGNDPVRGTGHHTREKTLLLAFGKKFKPRSLGVRVTLSDIGATAASYLGVGQTEAGTRMILD
ncbi:MAG: phosphopentomutase [Candidatus Fermentithermobacillus carboniphilus]|uniref:Phosphopentomutase n=1 Tax=Candidatus Fermentithermobacillus carboniphilus TaxID=3085328 RepID=A0AAT9LEB7_9FIRM|nr:MAG: phosphopentomutase [Candidatus Fermentithermobacillus carboniphilus]